MASRHGTLLNAVRHATIKIRQTLAMQQTDISLSRRPTRLTVPFRGRFISEQI
jgi:hypothetical protein